jgi:hypothetical protein
MITDQLILALKHHFSNHGIVELYRSSKGGHNLYIYNHRHCHNFHINGSIINVYSLVNSTAKRKEFLKTIDLATENSIEQLESIIGY